MTARIAAETNPCHSTQLGNNRPVFIQGRKTMEHESPGASPCMSRIDEAGHERLEKRTLRYKPGDHIIKEGEFSIALYLIVSGTVSILKKLHGEEVQLFELGPCDVFGEMVFSVGSHVPCTESAVAKDAVELEAWHYLALWLDYQKMRPIIQLLAVDMLNKLEKISIVLERLRLDKPPKPHDDYMNITGHEPSCPLKLATDEPVGPGWKRPIGCRLPDTPEPALFRPTGADIDEKMMRFYEPTVNIPLDGHTLNRKALMIQQDGGAPVKARGEDRQHFGQEDGGAHGFTSALLQCDGRSASENSIIIKSKEKDIALPRRITSRVKHRLTFKQGESIFDEGSEIRHICVILEGRVRIKKHIPGGMVTLKILDKGQVLGETSFFDKGAKLRAAAAVAETDVVLGMLNRDELQQELTRISPIQQDILAGLARKIRLNTATAALLAGS